MSYSRKAYKKARKKFFKAKKQKRPRYKMDEEMRMYRKRAGRKNRHHIHPRSRGGDMSSGNLLIMDERRHSAFHLIFGLRTFEEAALLLLRCARAKGKLWDSELISSAKNAIEDARLISSQPLCMN